MCVNNKEDHELIVIYTQTISELETNVVRWCKNCGGIVVDLDIDNRTSPGHLMEMRFPTICKSTY